MLPEADHNEVVGWAAARDLGRFSYVSLEDAEAHPRNALRAELTAELAADGRRPGPAGVARAATSRVERLVSLVLLGDLVSIYAAVLRGADPVDIRAIDSLKAAAGASASVEACPPPLPRPPSPRSSAARFAATLPAAA